MKALAPVLLVLLGACGRDPEAPVVVFAASSLREVAAEVAEEWSRRSSRPHRIQVEATSTLARQVREGAPADLLLAADPGWIDDLRPLDRFDWLGNRLVLVVPRDAPDADPRRLDSLALADAQVPAGRYALAALAHLGARLPDRTIHGQNVRDVLSKVSRGGARAGIVYATDVPIDPGVRACFSFPEGSHPPIVCSVALLRPAGRDLYDAFRAPAALEAARRRGFREAR